MERRLAAILASDMVGYSRLMEMDDEATLARQKQHRRELIDPAITQNRGRIVKTTGDGLIAEFVSAQDAVRCALGIQQEMTGRETAQADEQKIKYRVGISLGDVIFDEADMYGDGVNVAARLEGLARPGGVCISDIVYQTVQARVASGFRDLGSQRVKNISRPVRVWQWVPDQAPEHPKSHLAHSQQVSFCVSADGTHIAYASVGEGPPVLRAPHWLNHIEYEWQSPFMSPFLTRFARDHRLVRFDQRGNGLSDWDTGRVSAAAMIEDMEAVAAAAGLSRFALFGISQGAAFAIDYASRHPEQVACLVLFGGYVQGRIARNTPEEKKMYETALMMIREGWGSDTPVYRNFFTSAFLPDAPLAVQDSFDELQRVTVTPENAARIYRMNSRIDVCALARQLRVPTLVLHFTGDRVVPVSQGQLTARLIQGARFAELPGSNHIGIEGQPGFDQFFDAVEPFIRHHLRQ
ncbi:alpha/beta fold hydrolase [Leisingera thetidis]|uniref:alpha/beta fold hydrolase n=1 Tax=Leisingera thetidis TaxID=2930199 RepID=UPI0021F75590|nr:alpha/beta fold hydrolase [Leisingera thetidis]